MHLPIVSLVACRYIPFPLSQRKRQKPRLRLDLSTSKQTQARCPSFDASIAQLNLTNARDVLLQFLLSWTTCPQLDWLMLKQIQAQCPPLPTHNTWSFRQDPTPQFSIHQNTSPLSPQRLTRQQNEKRVLRLLCHHQEQQQFQLQHDRLSVRLR